jgi:hypothetical protein
MTDLRGRTFSDLLAGLNAGQHLAVDALVAFVDGELAPGARHTVLRPRLICSLRCATSHARLTSLNHLRAWQ